MELLKKDVHTEKIKSKTLLQVPIEEDINVSDAKPDVVRIIYSNGDIKIDEIKTGMDKIWVKGQLCYNILYQAEGTTTEAISGMQGNIPFLEEIYIDKLEGQDRVVCKSGIEDMRVHIINSRKLSIQSVISLEPRVDETVSDEICVELEGKTDADMANKLEYRKKAVDYLETIVKKRDLLRIHEETKLPSGMPEIGAVLWKSMNISNISFRPMEEKLAVSGDINIFIIYQEYNTANNNWYETMIPFNGVIECQGSRDNMIADISYDIGHEEITIREDSDGESRVIGIESTIGLEIKLFEKENALIVSDVYGVSCEVQSKTDEKEFMNLLSDTSIEEKLAKNISLDANEPKILQICHSNAKAQIDTVSFTEDTVKISGNVLLQVLYISSNEEKGFYPVKETIPFEVSKPILGLDKVQIEQYSIMIQTNQPVITIKDSSQAEARITLNIRMFIYDMKKQEILTDLKITPIKAEVLEKLPGFVIYYVKQGDSLWQIGKRYYVSVDRIKEINNLTSEEIKAGDRLLIVK